MTKDEARKILLPAMQVTLNQHRGFTLEELAAINTLVAEPAWLSLKDAPLTPDMVGQWAWVRWTFHSGTTCQEEVVIECSSIHKSMSDDIVFDCAETGWITHYQLIGPPPEFNKDKGVNNK